MKFGDKVKLLRTRKGWTQDELAEKLNKSKRTVVGYENSETYPRDRRVYAALAALFEVDVNYLLTESDEGSGPSMGAEEILMHAAALFAGGTLSPDDELAFVNEIQQLYLDSKSKSRRFAPRREGKRR